MAGFAFVSRIYGPWLRLNHKQARNKSKNRDTRKEKPTTNNHKKNALILRFFKTPIYIISSFYFILKQDHFRYLVFFKISTLGMSNIIQRWELCCSPLLMRRFILFLQGPVGPTGHPGQPGIPGVKVWYFCYLFFQGDFFNKQLRAVSRSVKRFKHWLTGQRV